MNEGEVLLKQYDVFTRLYIHESKVCWNLISLFVAVNVGLASVLAAMISWPRSPFGLLPEPFDRVWVVTLAGVFANFIGSALFYKNKVYRELWISKVSKIEDEMRKNDLKLEKIEVPEDVIRGSKEKHIFYELLKRIGNLDRAYFWPLAIALVWLAIFLVSLLLAFLS